MAPDPDKALNAIRRLAANKVCPNCGHEERMGFKDVCMKYKIFICSDCKSAHQAYSHRCKVRRRPPSTSQPRHAPKPHLRSSQSVTMSNWTMAEVEVLKHENGGGNAINMAKMFARFPEGAKRPTKGCHPDDLKAFINEAYNDLRWYDENGQVKGEPTPPPAARTVTMQAPSVKPSPSNGAAPPPVTASKSAPVQDLFGDFDAAPAPASNGWTSFESSPAPAASWTSFSAAPAPAPAAGFGADFGAFTASPAPAPPASFGDFAAAPPAPTPPQAAAMGGALLTPSPTPAAATQPGANFFADMEKPTNGTNGSAAKNGIANGGSTPLSSGAGNGMMGMPAGAMMPPSMGMGGGMRPMGGGMPGGGMGGGMGMASPMGAGMAGGMMPAGAAMPPMAAMGGAPMRPMGGMGGMPPMGGGMQQMQMGMQNMSMRPMGGMGMPGGGMGGGMGMGMGGAMGMPGGGMGGGMGMGGGAMGMASPSTPAAKPAAPPGGAVLQPTMVNPSKSKGEIMNLFG
eukprot:Transcript_11064.p1 GENE.Transcript_11064~~Transcript_11064.p1  ORF type:complete len:512 (+),score=176.98 Transcript_11064:71-1606(+)